ncbi:hypothetical protein LTR10_017420 [Elasticomyces elasticus]|uniref:Uncharacterized protein n=1 Tax=Exophiala sideris TaxID=1016849 RepID=A0ABR0JAJ4_9EURO|nr:hypothetical protein LTR10_017420 [Elasticomyces elasticus]KAK5030398.1 hypothetical protein LTS07_005182 [Exophiala sideris]KAK5038451.1 hypothetical protein LTR13_004198 [Exophiala sideris]KAK5060334.1 hypothetical protein LTR69_005651 [Exophiala sideris]KAK5183244.1 hypothetical protein LTR44_004245 [Eurotiomycetes sp. CCFEE 6388]
MSLEKPGPYIESLARFKNRFPYLYFLEKARREWQDDAGSCKATVLELHGDHFSRSDVRRPGELKDHLEARSRQDQPDEKKAGEEAPACKHRIYIIQDLSNAFLEILGSHFQIDPYVFASQAWVHHWSSHRSDFGMPQRLPSLHSRTIHSTLRYYELNYLHEETAIGRTHAPDSKYKLKSNLLRRVERQSSEDRPGLTVFFVRRNVSFWARQSEVVILTEPPIRFEDEYHKSEPYRHGYPDYIPWSPAAAASQSLPMTAVSMLEAIATYWTDVADPAEIQAVRADPSKAGDLLETICSSHWMVMFDYMWTKLNDSEMSLKEITDHHGWPEDKTKLISNVKKTLMQGIAWKRRLNWICGEMDASLKSLGVYSGASGSPLQSTDDHINFRYMRSQFEMLKSEYRQFSDYLTSILEVFQGETALEEARTSTKIGVASEALTRLSVQLAEKSYEEGRRSAEFAQISVILTAVGIVFIPLTYTASIFSMGSDYGPNGGHFWVYWAVAAPLAVVSIILFALFSRTQRLYDSLAWILFGPYAKKEDGANGTVSHENISARHVPLVAPADGVRERKHPSA